MTIRLAALLAASLLLSAPGCISYTTSESVDSKTQEVSLETTGIFVTGAKLSGTAYSATASANKRRTTETTKTTTVTGEFGLKSEATSEIEKEPLFGILILPVTLAVDMISLILSSPGALLDSAMADTGVQAPVASTSSSNESGDLAFASLEILTQGAGDVRTHKVIANDSGGFTLDITALAAEALVGPLSKLQVTVRYTVDGRAHSADGGTLSALQLLQAVEHGLSGNTASRRRTWEQLRDRSARDVRKALSIVLERDTPDLYFSRLKRLNEVPPAPRPARPAVVAKRPTPRPAPKPTPKPRPTRPAPKPRPAAPTRVAAARRTFVLIVGINPYADEAISDLRFAEADARAVFGFYAGDERSLTSRDRVRILRGKKATRVAVLKAIREQLVQKATRPTDAAILYIACHGFTDAEETYLACSDTQLDDLQETAIPFTTLQRYWQKIGAGTKLLISDACHAGGLANLRGLTVRQRVVDRTSTGISAVIAAAGANELSAEDEDFGHGVFTQVLLSGLRGNADANKSGDVTLGELSAFLKAKVPARAREVSGKQTPVIEIHGAGGASVPLTR